MLSKLGLGSFGLLRKVLAISASLATIYSLPYHAGAVESGVKQRTLVVEDAEANERQQGDYAVAEFDSIGSQKKHEQMEDGSKGKTANQQKFAPIKIKVLLSKQRGQVVITGQSKFKVYGVDKQYLGSWPPPLKVFAVGNELSLSTGGTSFAGTAFELVAENLSGFVYATRSYRGIVRMEIGPSGEILVINELPLEDYLRGVVPAEMPPLWHKEALKAQAVAARTYALRRIIERKQSPYHVRADTSDQIYLGKSKEHPRTDEAIRETEGYVITYEGEPIVAYYHSASGGKTKKGLYPYLESVESPEDAHELWEVQLSADEITAKLSASGYKIGKLEDVYVSNFGDLDLAKVVVIGTEGKAEFSPARFRSIMGMSTIRSSNFEIEARGTSLDEGDMRVIKHWMRVNVISAFKEKEVKVRRCTVTSGKLTRPMYYQYWALKMRPVVSDIVVRGSGYGHGLGMSQWGAKKLAEQGYTWQAILHRYYSNVQIQRIEELNLGLDILNKVEQ